MGKLRAGQGKDLAHGPSAFSLKTSNALRVRRDLPSMHDSAISSPVTLLQPLGSHSYKITLKMGHDSKTPMVPMDLSQDQGTLSKLFMPFQKFTNTRYQHSPRAI